jgi:hypothetical protein
MAKKEKLQVEIEVASRKIHVEHVSCPNGHDLCDSSRKIHGFPAIKLKIAYKGKEGIIYLDPVYGSFDHIEEGIKLPKGAVVEFFCPTCGVSMTVPEESCQLCASPMFVAYLPKGGIIEGCLKKGCYFHKMKIVDAEKQVARLFEDDTLKSYL